MTDPYQVLGVPSDATDEEIKKAYYALVKKYHPDNCQNEELKELASKKMQEINTAYETIKEWRASPGGTGGTSGTSGGASGQRAYNGKNAERYRRVREYINEGRASDADSLLEGVPYQERDAEWCFLKGCVFIRAGRYYDAIRLIETACRNDPGNEEYRATLEKLRNATAGGGYGRTPSSDSSCGNCDLCTTLCCANMLCNCCGGDMIRCC